MLLASGAVDVDADAVAGLEPDGAPVGGTEAAGAKGVAVPGTPEVAAPGAAVVVDVPASTGRSARLIGGGGVTSVART